MGAWDRAKTLATAFSEPDEVHAFVSGLVLTLLAGFVDPTMWAAVLVLSLSLYGLKLKKLDVKTKLLSEIQNEPQYYLGGVGLGVVLYVLAYNAGYIPDPVLVKNLVQFI